MQEIKIQFVGGQEDGYVFKSRASSINWEQWEVCVADNGMVECTIRVRGRVVAASTAISILRVALDLGIIPETITRKYVPS